MYYHLALILKIRVNVVLDLDKEQEMNLVTYIVIYYILRERNMIKIVYSDQEDYKNIFLRNVVQMMIQSRINASIIIKIKILQTIIMQIQH